MTSIIRLPRGLMDSVNQPGLCRRITKAGSPEDLSTPFSFLLFPIKGVLGGWTRIDGSVESLNLLLNSALRSKG